MIEWSDPKLWLFFMTGTIWGSFANVLILRIPDGESIVSPRSYCRSSNQSLAWYDLVPILSWLWLRGRSRYDGSRISVRYPFVEFLTGALFAGCYLRFGFSISMIEALIFCFGLVVVTFIDFDHYILPDVFTLPGIVIGLLGSLANAERLPADAFWGFFFGGGFLFMVAWLYEKLRGEEGMGGGDIKLLGWTGAVLGWQSIAFIILCSSFLGIFGGLFYAIKTGKGMKTVLPFGPFIAASALIYMFIYWPAASMMTIPLLDLSLFF